MKNAEVRDARKVEMAVAPSHELARFPFDEESLSRPMQEPEA
jgi:hypothetical protein